MNTLQERSVLMRFSSGIPGQHRKDKKVTSEVKASKGLGEHAGKWIKELWPENALAEIKTKCNEARDYHNTVTLPFGVKGDDASEDGATPAIAGIGILPAALILEYGDKMRAFKGELEVLVGKFLADPQVWVDWAIREHNGTFDPDNYPGCKEQEPLLQSMSGQKYALDADQFRKVMGKKFYIRTEPLPVPASSQFCDAITSLLGVDAESVNIRVRDAEQEAQRELLRRMIAPVKAMADKLSEQPKLDKKTGKAKDDIVFRDTLIGNIQEIVALAPKLNITGDQQIDQFCKEMEGLTRYTPDTLRDDKVTRSEAATKAAEICKRLTGYKVG